MRDVHTRLMALLFTVWALSAVAFFIDAVGVYPA